ncbi:MAG TPA: VOC family protein [Puia sp.]|nr:VOC family protein [Puia sp.]
MKDTGRNSHIRKMSPQFRVADLERSIEFYTQRLGFKVEFRYEDFYAEVMRDGCSIHLKLTDPGNDEMEIKAKNEDLDVVFSVDNIEKLFRELSVNGVEIIQSLRQMPYGREFYIADPDRHIFAFVEEK